MKAVIARVTPNNDKAVLFFPETKKDGQIDCFMDGASRRVGIDFYQATHHLNKEDSFKIAQAYAQQAKIPAEELIVKQRLPKSFNSKRKTDDSSATSLTLVKKEEKGETLQQMAQELHDSETKQVEATLKPAEKKAEQAASEQPRQKRKYERKQNKRSEAALRRFQQDMAAATAKASESLMTPVVPGPGVSQAQVDQSILDLAMAIAKVLKANPGAL